MIESDELPRVTVIGLCGYKRSGKDTTCDLLGDEFRKLCNTLGWGVVRPTVIRLAWADHVRRVAALQYDVAVDVMFDDARKDEIDPRWGLTYRQMQVIVGEAGRKAHRDTWTRPVTKVIDAELIRSRRGPLEPTLVLVSGTRFGREADVLRERGGQLWMVDRGLESDGTNTERDPRLLRPEVSVSNLGTIADLAAAVRGMLPAALAFNRAGERRVPPLDP